MDQSLALRQATLDDAPAIAQLIPLSVRALQSPYYTAAQMDAALGPIFAVDRQLIADKTYFVVEHLGQLVGCGGWSRRRAVYGGDHGRLDEDALLDPEHEPARIRAFFVHPDYARRGIGRSLLRVCEQAISVAGFRNIVLAATLAGEPLYAACGYAVVERQDAPLSQALTLPVVRMSKRLQPST